MIISAFADEVSTNLTEQIAALKKNGLEYIDLRVVNGKNIYEHTVEEAKEIYRSLSENGIKVNCIGSPVGKVNLSVDFEDYKNKFANLLDVTEAVKADKIRIFAFYEHGGNLELIVKYLKELVAMASARSIKLYLENEARVYGENADEVEQLLDLVPGLYTCYDPANYVLGGQDLDVAMEKLLDKKGTDFLHIKDATYDGKIVACGEGEGRVREAVEKCDIANLAVTIEPHLFTSRAYREIDGRGLNGKIAFDTAEEAFDYAVAAVRKTMEGLL